MLQEKEEREEMSSERIRELEIIINEKEFLVAETKQKAELEVLELHEQLEEKTRFLNAFPSFAG